MAVELLEQELQVLLNCGEESKIEIRNFGMNFNHRIFLQMGTTGVNGGCPCPYLIPILGHLLDIPSEPPGFIPSDFVAALNS